MNKLLTALAVAGVALSAAAHAQTVTAPTNLAPTITTTTTTTAPAAATSMELKDGTKIQMGANNMVSVMNADGSMTPAPDGAHVLKDGTTITTKDGKKVAE